MNIGLITVETFNLFCTLKSVKR